MIEIESTNLYPSLTFDEDKLRAFFKCIFSLHDHKSKGVLSVVFLNEEEHSKIHGDFLQDYRPTDVITFPSDPENEMVGEICVSVDRAISEAESRDLPTAKELGLYLIHGWLHLVGFDDQNEADRKIMRREEANAMSFVDKDELWPNFLLAPPSIQG
ncbi:MAG: rRNA maturation RNase YbeY [Opitutae bacterium]|nr:rRNA maturation RNase YbeY [Opitutae bacterium]MBT5716586.1 rRNA maturation RNase YbeY [Opitutae bacterium]